MTANFRQTERHRKARARVVAIPILPDDAAIEVWGCLQQAGHDGRSIVELQMALKFLTMSQIRRGIERINHVLQETREHPLVIVSVRGRGSVYRFAKDVDDYFVFSMRRYRELLTRASTELARAEGAILKWPAEVPVYIPKQARRIREDIGALLDDLAAFQGETDVAR